MSTTVHFKHPMGVKAKCKVTGYSGTIVSRVLSLNGMLQYGVQPPCKDDSSYIPDCMGIDEDDVEILSEEGLAVPAGDVTFDFEILEEVENILTGQKGRIIAARQWKNGCSNYNVSVGVDKETAKAQTILCVPQELAKIEKPKPIKEAAVAKKRTGGAMTKFERREKL